ncbi:conserved hypothetical protein (plasmid) [Rhizobium rhizogenes K84]|uniref:Uncharacterized protein n=1 Tax=Rhizobium rhizogenes (strain K84 / ATCC BAA-868) TaxID=311403 RepID=B9JPW4_RHIR8|nr:conserved hypothetical protein [Rhizobium rhizogenes K84]
MTGGEASDFSAVPDLLAIPVGKPRLFLADKGYDGNFLREELLIHGIRPVIPPKANRKNPPACDFRPYKDRNRIERDDTLSAGRRAYLRQFFIARKSRGAGLGRAAIELLLAERFKEPMVVRLEVLDSNPRGFGFWTAVGFQGYSRNLERTSGPGTA